MYQVPSRTKKFLAALNTFRCENFPAQQQLGVEIGNEIAQRLEKPRASAASLARLQARFSK